MNQHKDDEAFEYNRNIIREGLVLHEKYAEAATAQDAEREAFEESERANGRNPEIVLTEEERAWDENRDRQASIVAFHKKNALEQLDLDLGNSVLFPEYSRLLYQVCNPESVLVYDPALREFGMMETWGPATISIGYCPFTGKKLPKSLRDAWFEAVNAIMGSEDWSIEQARDQLPAKYFNEQWWSEKEL